MSRRRAAAITLAASDPLAADIDVDVPSAHGFVALLEAFRATGGTAPGDIVGRLLEEHQAGNAVSLAKLIYTGQVFGFEWRASLWIPMFQFDADDLRLKAAPQHVRAALPSEWSGWAVAAWFATPNAHLDGCCPADMLNGNVDANVDTDGNAVLRAAQAWQAAEDWAHMRVPRHHAVTARA
jgi:hypothetical protein